MKFEFDVKKDVEYSLESKKIDLEFFCKLNELTRKTIYNQTQEPNNFKTLNKIYNLKDFANSYTNCNSKTIFFISTYTIRVL